MFLFITKGIKFDLRSREIGGEDFGGDNGIGSFSVMNSIPTYVF